MRLATVAILGLVPLEKIFDYLGEQMALYCGQSIGDLIVITLNKCAVQLGAWLEHRYLRVSASHLVP